MMKAKHKKKMKILCQKGGFSPFMFGVLAALSIFSTMLAQWAKEDLKQLQSEKLKRQQAHSEDIKEAIEIAILSENSNIAGNNYSQTYDVGRAQGFLSSSNNTTRGGAAIQIQEVDSSQVQDIQNKRIAISSSDDTFLRTDVAGLANEDAIAAYDSGLDGAMATIDTEALRNQQVKHSRQLLEKEASLLYTFFTENSRFPANQGEYDTDINALTNYKDTWGNDFTYTYASDTEATLGFTTPWGKSFNVRVDMN
jgi:hypothetical protein